MQNKNKITVLFLISFLFFTAKTNAQVLLESAIGYEWFDTLNLHQLDAWNFFIDTVTYKTIPISSIKQANVHYLIYKKDNDYESDDELQKPLLVISDSVKLLKNLHYVELRGEIAAKASIQKLLDLPITHLSFKTSGIDTIATPNMHLNSLKWLSLDDCYLNAVPVGISQFNNLEVLVLGHIGGHFDRGNEIAALPNEILQLTKLKKLYLDANLFKTMPSLVLSLRSLEILSIANNSLKTVPTEIEQLTRLEVLDLASNRLTTLPSSIQNLKKLKTLELYGNKLTEFPEWITKLKNLEYVSISGNNITSVPNNLHKLTKLKYLYVDKKAITPKQLQQLQKRLPLCKVITN